MKHRALAVGFLPVMLTVVATCILISGAVVVADWMET